MTGSWPVRPGKRRRWRWREWGAKRGRLWENQATPWDEMMKFLFEGTQNRHVELLKTLSQMWSVQCGSLRWEKCACDAVCVYRWYKSINVAKWTALPFFWCVFDDLFLAPDFRHLPGWYSSSSVPTPCQLRPSQLDFSFLDNDNDTDTFEWGLHTLSTLPYGLESGGRDP